MPFRSVLFTPATRMDRLDRALEAAPDWVALDLEDGVGPQERNAARDALSRFAASGLADVADRIAVRINSPNSPDGIRDLAAMLDWPAWPGLLILPKTESVAQVRQLADLAATRTPEPSLLLTLETARGIANAKAVAGAAPAGSAIAYGSVDHMVETGGDMSGTALAFGRAVTVNAAAIAGLPALDGVCLNYRDESKLAAEAELAKSLGFAGKIAIHPDQVGLINATFTPAESEIEDTKALLSAARAAGGGAFAYQGRMVDEPLLARARRIASTFGRLE